MNVEERESSIDVERQEQESNAFTAPTSCISHCTDKICLFTGSVQCNEQKRKLSTIEIENENETDAAKKRRGESDIDVEKTNASAPIPHPLFLTDLVIDGILCHLPNTELKHCRAISRKFKDCTDRLIRKRRFTCIFQYKWNTKEYYLQTLKEVSSGGINNFTLSTLTEVIKKNPRFPIISFHFEEGTLISSDLQEFLSVCGENIEKLKLSVFCPPIPSPIYLYPAISFFENLLVNQVPNLRILKLSNCPSEWTNLNSKSFYPLFPKTSGKEITLPLTKLCVPANFFISERILEDLLRAACNLQVLNDKKQRENAKVVLKLNKFHLLKQCKFRPPPEDIELYEKYLPTSKSRLVNLRVFVRKRYFEVPEMLPRFSKILSYILSASSASLNEIAWLAQIGFLTNLTIPVLPKISHIEFYKYNNDTLEDYHLPKKQFPPGFQFSTSFPNLTHVWLSIHFLNSDYEWEACFDNYSPVLSVKFLCMDGRKLPTGWFQKFATIFPRIEIFWVKTAHFNTIEAGQAGLWSLDQLKNLVLYIDILDEFNAVPSLDSAFTGFSSETCNESLKSVSVTNLDTLTINGAREFPSIVNLKNLESLQLEFKDRSQLPKSEYPTILTRVTGLYAFCMCPRLKVTAFGGARNAENVEALRNSLRNLEDYVNLDFPSKTIGK